MESSQTMLARKMAIMISRRSIETYLSTLNVRYQSENDYRGIILFVLRASQLCGCMEGRGVIYISLLSFSYLRDFFRSFVSSSLFPPEFPIPPPPLFTSHGKDFSVRLQLVAKLVETMICIMYVIAHLNIENIVVSRSNSSRFLVEHILLRTSNTSSCRRCVSRKAIRFVFEQETIVRSYQYGGRNDPVCLWIHTLRKGVGQKVAPHLPKHGLFSLPLTKASLYCQGVLLLSVRSLYEVE